MVRYTYIPAFSKSDAFKRVHEVNTVFVMILRLLHCADLCTDGGKQ